MESQKTFIVSEVTHTNTVMLRLHSEGAKLSVAEWIGMAKEKLSILSRRLHNDLSSEVFDDGTEEVIEKVICDLISLLMKIY